MRAGRANRLARRAGRRRPDGTLTWRARRAWARLAAAAEARDGTATAAMREAWLADPRDDTAEYVRRWCTPADVVAAAVDPGRAAGSRAAIGAYCVRHDLAPENPVECALFFVLTGQHEQYQALDLDGTLLASAYRGAAEATREALRHTMIGVGELSLVRVIADRSDQALIGVEADYLAGQLADEHDWERLWRLIPTMPLASAARAARLFPDWRPADDLGRAFFARLAGTDPAVITALGQAAVTRLDVHYRVGPANSLPSFAPDNSEIAVMGTLFGLPDGRIIENYKTAGQVVALGDATIVHTARRGPLDLSVVRDAPGRPRETLLPRVYFAEIARTPDGFVVLADGALWRGDATRSCTRVAPVELPIGAKTSGKYLHPADLHGVDPVSGNLAFVVDNRDVDGDGEHLVLVDANLQLLAHARSHDGFGYAGAFCGPDQILVENVDGDVLELWRRDGPDLALAAAAEIDARVVVPVPARNLVVVRRREGQLTWLDASTLVEVDPPAGFPMLDTGAVSFSLDGSLAAVAVAGHVEVYDLRLHRLADLATRSLSQARVTDLEAVAELRKRKVAAHVRPAVDLLHAGLAYRFGADIAVGSGTRIAAGGDDIALGGG
jgi:hypothetical protein